jgi:hypothetical protein
MIIYFSNECAMQHAWTRRKREKERENERERKKEEKVDL